MKIIFAYNVNRGPKTATISGLKKVFRSGSHPCKLSSLTFSTLRVKREWKLFVDSLDQEVEFLYKNEFDKRFKKHPFSLPAIFRDSGKHLEQLMSAEDFDSIKDLDGLIEKAGEKIKN